MAQEKDDFKRLSEKYENELMNYYRAHAPTVLSYPRFPYFIYLRD